MKSHLFPRAFVKRVKGDEKNVIEGSRHRPGMKTSQSGHWDDQLLCEAHEKAFASIDDYAARFCRRFERAATLSTTGKSYTTPNPRPDLLLRFTYATVWRYAASNEGSRNGLDLGPYRKLIERDLFEGQPLALQALVSRSNLIDANGDRVEVGIPPYKRKLLDWTVWHFTIAGFDFYLKTDQRAFPAPWNEFLINDNDPVTVPLIDPLRLDSIPMFQPIFSQMRKTGLNQEVDGSSQFYTMAPPNR